MPSIDGFANANLRDETMTLKPDANSFSIVFAD
jgi:hypothetical protein